MAKKIKSKKSLETRQAAPAVPREFIFTRTHLIILFGFIAAVIGIYMIASPRPYDDDNIGRYFMAQAALDKPEYFINMWGRPLAILFFMLPAQAGYWFCAAATALLTLGTCYFIYRTAVITKAGQPWLSVIFLFFQPLFLITSFSLCTEPLAAFLLSVGLYYYYKESWKTAAIALAFMPLARTELVLLLPLFAVMIIRKKQWLAFLLMGTGLALFQIAGMAMTGDTLFLLTASKSFGHGFYQNGPFAHYFERFIFIVGPVVFVFIILQLIADARAKQFSVLNSSLILMFAVHVYLYWKGNVASIGFLRHFVAVSPVMALLALQGFNRFFYDESPGMDKQERLLTTVVLAVCSLMILAFYSYEIIGDYFLSDQKEYLKFVIALILVLFFIMRHYLDYTARIWKTIIIYGVAIMTAGYALLKEKPLQLAPEHQTVKTFHGYYEKNLQGKIPMMMVAHPWFFFFDDFNYYLGDYASAKYMEMRTEKLDSLTAGSFIAWDSHYSWRLDKNVQLDTLKAHPDTYQFRKEFISADRKFAFYLFEKMK